MKKLFILMMLISGEGWAEECHRIKLDMQPKEFYVGEGRPYFCYIENQTCVFTGYHGGVSCFPTNSKIK